MSAITAAARAAASRARSESVDIKTGTVTALNPAKTRASVSVAGSVIAGIPVGRSVRTTLTVGDTVLVASARPAAWVIDALD